MTGGLIGPQKGNRDDQVIRPNQASQAVAPAS
jgi:hypothetical protein